MKTSRRHFSFVADLIGTNRSQAYQRQGEAALLAPLNRAAAAEREAITPLGKAALLVSQVALIAFGYYLAARLGLRFRFRHSYMVAVWPANAVLVSALLLTPRTRWWLVLVTAAFAHAGAVGSYLPLWRLLWQLVGNSAFALATAEVLRRFAGHPLHFESRRQVIAYTPISFAMAAFFALTTPAFILSALRVESNYTPCVAFFRTTLSNATALLLVVPVILLWAQNGFRRVRDLRRTQIYEATAILSLLLAVGLVVLGARPPLAWFPGALLWVFPPLLWAAVRFGPLGASTSLLLVAALSLLGAARQLGPFVLRTNADQVLSLQLFWVVLCLPLMLLAVAIRERELTEEALQNQRVQLAHASRMATAGELSAALAHELRQPLASILLNAQVANRLLARHSSNPGEVRAILKDIVDESTQAGSIVDSLLSFLRRGESHLESRALDSVVRDALVLGNSVLAVSRVQVETQFAAGLPRVRGDPVQLLQVVLNLIVNACEAMSDLPAPQRRLWLGITRAGDQRIELLVADRGPGLPLGAEERVFDPFFTTKKKGLGLGLAIGRSIAIAHGGQLRAENSPLGGATFHLVLPAEHIEAAAKEVATSLPETSVPHASCS